MDPLNGLIVTQSWSAERQVIFLHAWTPSPFFKGALLSREVSRGDGPLCHLRSAGSDARGVSDSRNVSRDPTLWRRPAEKRDAQGVQSDA